MRTASAFLDATPCCSVKTLLHLLMQHLVFLLCSSSAFANAPSLQFPVHHSPPRVVRVFVHVGRCAELAADVNYCRCRRLESRVFNPSAPALTCLPTIAQTTNSLQFTKHPVCNNFKQNLFPQRVRRIMCVHFAV